MTVRVAVGLGFMLGMNRCYDSLATPVQQELFADNKEHHADLGNGEKAPDGSLFLKVRRNPRRKIWSKSPKENSLNNHIALHHKERREHEERVNGRRRTPVSRVIQRHRP